MRDSLVLRFLYHTVLGRMLLKLLVCRKVSKIAALFLSSHLSAWMAPCYIKRYNIPMHDVEIPPGGFASFNAFFTRKKKINYDNKGKDWLKSPCDGWLTVTKIRRNIIFDIKNTNFSLEDLLKDPKLSEKFRNGTAFIFRLTPADYHRYCYGADGKILCSRKIDGRLHCVRPIALRTFPVFAQNAREYQIIETKEFGMMVQMEIGALLVGKINNHKELMESGAAKAGKEKGYFAFGGSTIVMLFQKDAVSFCEKLYERQNSNGEIRVSIGEAIAKASQRANYRQTPLRRKDIGL